ncbi:hydrolase [Natrialba sp. SSL1]|uniref:hydrolase n=1 Tax=Natrialba sp. SSL1 TaxID=1869245 RepID=UPI0008F88217|nr:hydrolase [Natrialba sp. SSL1]OIB59212.1 hydrolase [Natrialba sp. SSL1]
MAVTNPSSRESVPVDEQEAGVGMHHVTVVPTNFEAAETDTDSVASGDTDGQDD